LATDGDDLWRLRLAAGSTRPPSRGDASGGTPAFLGKVTTAAPAVGKFLLVDPVLALGPEVEGGTPSFTVSVPGAGIAIYLLGPAVPVTGDYLVCKFVDYRWVAERGKTGGGGGGHRFCGCPATPDTFTFTWKYSSVSEKDQLPLPPIYTYNGITTITSTLTRDYATGLYISPPLHVPDHEWKSVVQFILPPNSLVRVFMGCGVYYDNVPVVFIGYQFVGYDSSSPPYLPINDRFIGDAVYYQRFSYIDYLHNLSCVPFNMVTGSDTGSTEVTGINSHFESFVVTSGGTSGGSLGSSASGTSSTSFGGGSTFSAGGTSSAAHGLSSSSFAGGRTTSPGFSVIASAAGTSTVGFFGGAKKPASLSVVGAATTSIAAGSTTTTGGTVITAAGSATASFGMGVKVATVATVAGASTASFAGASRRRAVLAVSGTSTAHWTGGVNGSAVHIAGTSTANFVGGHTNITPPGGGP
jgi:hypothetical protein